MPSLMPLALTGSCLDRIGRCVQLGREQQPQSPEEGEQELGLGGGRLLRGFLERRGLE